MGKHGFSFEGGDILSRINAWWFVSYMYYQEINKTYKKWTIGTEKTIKVRMSYFNRSSVYHIQWLHEVLKMERLDVHKNSGNVSSIDIKRMAKEILVKIDGKLIH